MKTTKIKKSLKKAQKLETLVNFILDKSGSMSTIQDATIGGFNEYLNTLKKDGNEYSFSLTLFDTSVESPQLNKSIKDIPELSSKTFVPDGMTALYDAVCKTINEVKKTVKDNQKVLTVIMTDGAENSSREYSQKDLKKMVEDLEKSGNWSFVFLGANQDSFATASAFGVGMMNTANFSATGDGMTRAMHTMATGTQSFAMSSATSTSNFFSPEQQNINAGAGLNSPSLNMQSQVLGADQHGNIYAADTNAISAHFSKLGKKSWDSRRKKILGE